MLYVFKIIGKKIKYSPKREGASSRLRKDNAAGNFGDTILWPSCWTVRGALSQSILDNWAVSQELQDAVLKGRVDLRARSQVIDVQTQMQSFNFFFGLQLGVLVLRQAIYSLFCDTRACTCLIVKLSKLQKYSFHHYKAWERKLVFLWFFEKFRASKQKLEIDYPKPPTKRKALRHWKYCF